MNTTIKDRQYLSYREGVPVNLYECIRAHSKGNDTKAYIMYLLANFCMPTLLKLKSSSLFFVMKDKIGSQGSFIDIIENEISRFGCRFTILYENAERYSMLIYHPNLLAEVLNRKENAIFLNSFGYELAGDKIGSVLAALKENYRLYQEHKEGIIDRPSSINRYDEGKTGGFPHEIGILLGYPTEDVRDFIRYRGKNYILCGFWKVYHEAENARHVFDRYRRVREEALRSILDGKSMDDVISHAKSFCEGCYMNNDEEKEN